MSHIVGSYFNSPGKVLLSCLALAFALLVTDGTLIQLWSLHRNKDLVKTRIETYRTDIKNLQSELEQANQPEFVEKRARARFDLVGKDEIVFVFSED